MDRLGLWRIYVYFAIALKCLSYSQAQEVDECSPRCWTPKLNHRALGATKQDGVINEDDCKTLCLNTESCAALDWSKSLMECWFHMSLPSTYEAADVNHWIVTNCTDECAPYCWRPVKIGVNVAGGSLQLDINDENRCKHRCSNRTDCYGVDWYNACYLILTESPPKNSTTQGRHWDIKRNLPTSCSSYTSTVRRPTTEDHTSATVGIKSNSSTPLQSSTDSVEEGTARCSDNLMTGIIVLAVFLGLCILVIIGLLINTIRIGRQPYQKSDVKSIGLDNNYEGLQKIETKERSADGIYTDLVQGNPNDFPKNLHCLELPPIGSPVLA